MNFMIIFGFIFAVVMASYTVYAFYKRQLMIPGFLLWMSIWVGLFTFLLRPALLSVVSDLFGVDRAIDVIVYVSIMALFYMTYKNYQLSLKQSSEITKLVRQISKKK